MVGLALASVIDRPYFPVMAPNRVAGGHLRQSLYQPRSTNQSITGEHRGARSEGRHDQVDLRVRQPYAVFSHDRNGTIGKQVVR